MADLKISQLTSGTAASGDQIPINRSGTNYRITAGDIAALKQAAGSDTQIQFNDGGTAFAGDSTLTFNKTSKTLGTNKVALAGSSSGTTTLQASAAAGSTTVTFPASTGTVALTSDLSSYAPLAGATFTGATTVSGASFSLSGNISSAAWTTNGIRYKNASATLTDTSSSGTVAAAYTNVFGGNTIAASNSTTFTDYATTYLAGPTAGTNVTFTNKWALLTGEKIKSPGYAVSSITTDSGTSRTLSAADNGTVIYFTSSSAITVTTATGLGAGFSCVLIQGGTGQITVAQGSSTTLASYGSFLKSAGQYAALSIISPVADTFILTGNTA